LLGELGGLLDGSDEIHKRRLQKGDREGHGE
jgi:hypothetical protein